MRTPINRQLSLGQPALSEIALDVDSRFELVPILAGLRHLHGRRQTRRHLLELVAADVLGDADPDRGREGMSFWQILVLAVVRQGCDYDFAALSHAANHDGLVRAFLQTGPLSDEGFAEKTVHENVSKLRPQTLEQIAYAIAEAGHELAPQACLEVRGDSFVVQANIHYPTDSSLLLDGIRKLTTLSRRLADEQGSPGWRQAKHLHKKAKRLGRRIGRIAKGRRKDRGERLEQAYGDLIDLARRIADRALDLYVATRQAAGSPLVGAQREEILRFVVMTDYVASLAERRVLHGETIPPCRESLQPLRAEHGVDQPGQASGPDRIWPSSAGCGRCGGIHRSPRGDGDRGAGRGRAQAGDERGAGASEPEGRTGEL